MINKMIKQQNIAKVITKISNTKSNLFPSRITQLTSTSYEKFINTTQKIKERKVSSKRCQVQQPSRSSLKPKSKTVTLDFDKIDQMGNNNTGNREMRGKSMDALTGKNKKTYYLNFIKSKSQDESQEVSQNEQSKLKRMTLFQFSQNLMYNEVNFIKRKKNKFKSHLQTKIYRIKSEHHHDSSILVVQPRVITKKDSQAINNFLGTDKIYDQSIMQTQKANINAYTKHRSFLKRKYLSKQMGKDIQNTQFSPFKKQTSKKEHFSFGMYQRPFQSKNTQKLLIYHDFIWKINFSNGIFVNSTEKQQNLKVFVGTGNNSNLVKSLIKKRFWLNLSESSENCHFIWSQLRNKNFYLGQKQFKGQSVSVYHEDVEDYERQIERPEKKIFNSHDYKNWCNYYENNEINDDIITQKSFKKRILLTSQKHLQKQNPSSHKIHNHFINNGYLGNKKALFYLLKNYYTKLNKDVFMVLPLTFHITRSVNDPEWKKFQLFYQQLQKDKQRNNQSNIWIIKPGESSNQGKGINVYYDLEDIRLRIKSGERNKDGTLRTFILQKYIEHPFLYHGRKFDIRHFLLITCVNGIFKAYWYGQGYIRTSSSHFSIRRGSNLFIHLTNDAVQKNSKDYGRFQQGNKISYDKMNKYMNKYCVKEDTNIFFENILPQMKAITLDAVKSTYLSLDQQRRENNFELFGMDFMIDQDFHPWLIQINTNPCLQTNCPLLNQIIPELLEQTLRICLDTSFPPPDEWPLGKKIWIPENIWQKTKFELIFDQTIDGKGVQDILGEKIQVASNMGRVEEESEVFENEGRQIVQQIE